MPDESSGARKRLCVVGAGRSGAVTAACLASLGHRVVALDIDGARVEQLQAGSAPFFEPGLDELIRRGLAEGRLSFTTDVKAAADAEFLLLSVDTPPRSDGKADLTSLSTAIRQIGPLLKDDALLVMRSTVPVGTNAWIASEAGAHAGRAVDVVSNPEFLREGHAVEDFLRPERIVIGARNEEAARAVADLYAKTARPVVFASLETAELIKYASNAYLANSISFINEIANICDRVGADISVVSQALALDPRIGQQAYLRPGIGFGGGCLPKDLRALVATAEHHGYEPELLRAIITTNELQPARVVARLREFYPTLDGLAVAVLGLSFKGDTFDTRSSPALSVIELLVKQRVRVRAFDPLADSGARAALCDAAELCPSIEAAVAGTQALVIATDHSEFRALDLARLAELMSPPVVIDARNVLDQGQAVRAGFHYAGFGRSRPTD